MWDARRRPPPTLTREPPQLSLPRHSHDLWVNLQDFSFINGKIITFPVVRCPRSSTIWPKSAFASLSQFWNPFTKQSLRQNPSAGNWPEQHRRAEGPRWPSGGARPWAAHQGLSRVCRSAQRTGEPALDPSPAPVPKLF